jgi:hypothetical protein
MHGNVVMAQPSHTRLLDTALTIKSNNTPNMQLIHVDFEMGPSKQSLNRRKRPLRPRSIADSLTGIIFYPLLTKSGSNYTAETVVSDTVSVKETSLNIQEKLSVAAGQSASLLPIIYQNLGQSLKLRQVDSELV